MRPLPTEQRDRYLARRAVVPRVEVQAGDGAWVDLSAFFRSFRWQEDRDSGAVSGSLSLRRDRTVTGVLESLVPLVGASPLNQDSGGFDPRLNPFRGVRVTTAALAPGQAPGTLIDAERIRVFRGVIDDPSFGGAAPSLTVPVRDLAAPVQDAIIRVERVYGSVAGTPIQNVLAALLRDNGFIDPGDGSLTVEVLGDTQGWSIRPYRQARGVSVWEACRTLALQMGWDFRYWWHADGTYRPTLLEPRRDTSTPDRTYTAAQILDLPSLRLNGTDVRNDGEMRYRDAATGQVAVAYARDAGSILAYGRRVFGISEDATSNIDTAAEAQQMIDAAVADLATPALEQQAVHPYQPDVQLGDVVQYPDLSGTVATLYDAAQRFGVVGWSHEISVGADGVTARTTLTLKGRPIGAYARWLALMGQRAAAALTIPAPRIGPLMGEATAEAGSTGWGGCWLPVTFDAATDAVDVFATMGPESPLDAPLLDEAGKAYAVRRLEGTTAQATDWSTIAFLACVPEWYKKTHSIPVGTSFATGIGLPITHEVRAHDVFTATLGDVTTVDVAREGTASVLTWSAAASTSPFPIWLVVWRNGFALTLLPWATSGTWRDEGLPAGREYVYQVQALTYDGVSCARSGRRSGVQRLPEVPPPVDLPPTPVGTAAAPAIFTTATTSPTGGPAVLVEVVPEGQSAGVTDFVRVERAPGVSGGTWSLVRDLPNDGTGRQTWLDETVLAGSTVRYRATGIAAGLTDSAPQVPIPPTVTLPTMLAAPVISASRQPGGIRVAGTFPAGTQTVRLERAVGAGYYPSGPYVVIQPAVPVSSFPYMDAAITLGQSYRYQATAQATGRADSDVSAPTTPVLA